METTFPLLTAALAAAARQGIEAELIALEPRTIDPVPAPTVRLGVDGHAMSFVVDLKPDLAQNTLADAVSALDRFPANKRKLLVARHVSPPLAQALKERDVAFLDTVGNAYLRLPGVLVWVTGRKLPAAVGAVSATPQAFQHKGLKLMFGLMVKPGLAEAPYRQIVAETGVALGTVTCVMRDLQGMGYLTAAGRRRKLRGTRNLLDDWASAYRHSLRPRLLIGRYNTSHMESWQDWRPENHGALWGGESAAAVLTDNPAPELLTLYTDQPTVQLIEDRDLHGVKRGELVARVEIRRKFWTMAPAHAHPAVTPPALIYADLLATGSERCVAAAETLFAAHLARFFE